MEDVIEIDLKKLILNLMANWKWILGISFLFGLVAFLFSYLQPNSYQAKAVIAITIPRYIANFDSQYETINPSQPSSKAIIDVLTSDEIVSSVYELWESAEKNKMNLSDFREKVMDATAGSDTSIIFLKVKLKDAQEATRLVNYWAEISVKRINALFSGNDENQIKFFDDQIIVSEGDLASSEDALVEFESKDLTSALNNELESILSVQSGNLRKQKLLNYARLDATGMLQTLEKYRPGDQASKDDLLNFQVLQLRIYSDLGFGSAPLQFQISGTGETEPQTIAEFRTSINNMISVIDLQTMDLQKETDQIVTQITDYQMQIQELANEKHSLDLLYNVSKDTYETLLRKQKETLITIADQSGDAQVASLANVPDERMPKNSGRNTAIGFLAASVFACGFVLVRNWWR